MRKWLIHKQMSYSRRVRLPRSEVPYSPICETKVGLWTTHVPRVRRRSRSRAGKRNPTPTRPDEPDGSERSFLYDDAWLVSPGSTLLRNGAGGDGAGEPRPLLVHLWVEAPETASSEHEVALVTKVLGARDTEPLGPGSREARL